MIALYGGSLDKNEDFSCYHATFLGRIVANIIIFAYFYKKTREL